MMQRKTITEDVLGIITFVHFSSKSSETAYRSLVLEKTIMENSLLLFLSGCVSKCGSERASRDLPRGNKTFFMLNSTEHEMFTSP